MTEAELKRLVKGGYIVSYEILEQDQEGNVTDMRIQPWPALDKVKLSKRLAAGEEAAIRKRNHFGGLG